MTYQEFANSFITRVQAALAGLKDNLVIAGVRTSSITIEPIETPEVQDLRYRITATKSNKTFIAYIELTATGLDSNGQMLLVITLYVEGNGGQITTSYSSGTPQAWNDPNGIDALLTKLTEVENISAGELRTSARAFLGV